jgi:hypothetical protein
MESSGQLLPLVSHAKPSSVGFSKLHAVAIPAEPEVPYFFHGVFRACVLALGTMNDNVEIVVLHSVIITPTYWGILVNGTQYPLNRREWDERT